MSDAGRPRLRFASLRDPDTLREFVRNIQEGIYITNERGEILDANPAFLAMLGVATLEELQAIKASDLLVDPAMREHELELLRRDGAIREFELQLVRPDGTVLTVLDTTYAVHDPGSGEVYYHGILVDISARKELEERLREQGRRDPLTGCWNRRYLAELQQQLARIPGAAWGCLFMDIDHFKQFNDEHGHQAGDVILVKMARFLQSQVRAEEAVVRMGGDEFAVILIGADDTRTEHVAKRLQLAALRTAPVAFSLGWAARRHRESLEKTLGRADEDLLAVRVVERAPQRRDEDRG